MASNLTTNGKYDMLNTLRNVTVKARLVGTRRFLPPGGTPSEIQFFSPLENISMTDPTGGTTSLSAQVQFDVNFDNYDFETIIINGIELFNSAGDTSYLTAQFAQSFVYESEGFFDLTALNITII